MLAPLPPNIEAPAGIADSKLRQRLAAAREQGRLVIGHFGSIYPGKQPNALLRIGALLKARGLNPLIVYIGSFIRGVDTVEESFYARAAELGVIDDVVVSGYVESDHEVFGLFSEVHAFCYPLDEGLTARRSSILTCVQSGRPLIVTGPALEDEFDHHPRFQGIDPPRRHRAGGARIRGRSLCRPDRLGAEMADSAGAGSISTAGGRTWRRRCARELAVAAPAHEVIFEALYGCGSMPIAARRTAGGHRDRMQRDQRLVLGERQPPGAKQRQRQHQQHLGQRACHATTRVRAALTSM